MPPHRRRDRTEKATKAIAVGFLHPVGRRCTQEPHVIRGISCWVFPRHASPPVKSALEGLADARPKSEDERTVCRACSAPRPGPICEIRYNGRRGSFE